MIRNEVYVSPFDFVKIVIYYLLGDTYEIYVSPFDFVKIFIIYLFIYYLSGGLYNVQTTL